MSPVLSQLTSGFQTRQIASPKSVLGFYGVVIAVTMSAAVGASTALLWSGRSVYLVPWILGIAFLFVAAVVAAVVFTSRRDPSKLMLTHVTGTEYTAIQQQTVLGDSAAGERLASLNPVPVELVAPEPERPPIGPGDVA